MSDGLQRTLRQIGTFCDTFLSDVAGDNTNEWTPAADWLLTDISAAQALWQWILCWTRFERAALAVEPRRGHGPETSDDSALPDSSTLDLSVTSTSNIIAGDMRGTCGASPDGLFTVRC